jgi:uncharacterized membrane protein
MVELTEAVLPQVIAVLTVAAATLLILGFLIATWKWAIDGLITKKPSALEDYRRALGRTILIGLEVLLAATIIKTITVSPTLEEFGLLVVLVAIRTAIGWTTSLEINGRWPWQRMR